MPKRYTMKSYNYKIVTKYWWSNTTNVYHRSPLNCNKCNTTLFVILLPTYSFQKIHYVLIMFPQRNVCVHFLFTDCTNKRRKRKVVAYVILFHARNILYFSPYRHATHKPYLLSNPENWIETGVVCFLRFCLYILAFVYTRRLSMHWDGGNGGLEHATRGFIHISKLCSGEKEGSLSFCMQLILHKWQWNLLSAFCFTACYWLHL